MPGSVNNPTADVWLEAGAHEMGIKYFEGYGWSALNGQDGGASFSIDANLIPEPSTVLALVCGLCGISGVLSRSRRSTR